jgi:hypothetical protein
MGFLIDTCIWVDVERGKLSPPDVAQVTDLSPVYISPITIAELKFGAEIAMDPSIRQKRLAALNRLKRKPLLRIDEVTGDIFAAWPPNSDPQGEAINSGCKIYGLPVKRYSMASICLPTIKKISKTFPDLIWF